MSKVVDKLDQVGADSIDLAKQALEKGADFVMEQAPLVCEEIIKVGLLKNGIGIVICIALILTFCLISRKVFKVGAVVSDKLTYNDSMMSPQGWCYFLGYLFNILCIVPVITMAYYIYCFSFILIAPRLYLIEYFSQLLKR
jgi:hypothetical protein